VRYAIALIRPQQWIKNFLVFVPLVTSHNLFHFSLLIAVAIAIVCFCFCASAVYVLNDLADIDADRRHPSKRNRPFAAGNLPLTWGLPIAGLLLSLAFTISCLALPLRFSAVLALYFVMTCGYSFFAKGVVMLDVLLLAALYTIRVLGGAMAAGVTVSDWLMAFSMFLFFSLAFAKRYAELERLASAEGGKASGRGYHASDIGLIESMGPASGLIAVLVLSLYINGEQMKTLYRNPWPLWLICPILLYWISRLWIQAKRGEITGDPIVFALRDRTSVCLGVIVAALLAVASFW
jgi:4-hydroxybenzoate polyprenyltransferase